jgi:hypothetical protein
MMEALSSSETLVITTATWHNISEVDILQTLFAISRFLSVRAADASSSIIGPFSSHKSHPSSNRRYKTEGTEGPG